MPTDPAAAPQILDENGNPVDDETARQILEQMAHDARIESERLREPRKDPRRDRAPWSRDDTSDRADSGDHDDDPWQVR